MPARATPVPPAAQEKTWARYAGPIRESTLDTTLIDRGAAMHLGACSLLGHRRPWRIESREGLIPLMRLVR